MKDAIEDEDRSKNIMVFGLAEDDGEQLDDKVSNVFMSLGEKPRSAAVRVGRRSEEGTGCRPVKVVLASSTAVRQLLLKARLLRRVEQLKAVYLCPDRSPQERECQRKLVLELKEKSNKQVDQHHYIKGGKVMSVAKTAING